VDDLKYMHRHKAPTGESESVEDAKEWLPSGHQTPPIFFVTILLKGTHEESKQELLETYCSGWRVVCMML